MKRTAFTLLVVFAASLAYAQTSDGVPPPNEGVCDELIDLTPGLYGLCVAFSEAQDCLATLDPATGVVTFDESCRPSSPRILANYNKRKGPHDPEMPGLNILETGCPCWTEDEIGALVVDMCEDHTEEDWLSIWLQPSLGGYVEVESWGFGGVGGHCYFSDSVTNVTRYMETSPAQTSTCYLSVVDRCEQ